MNGDDALRIMADVGTRTPIGKSRVTYDAAAKAFRRAVEREWEAYREQYPKAILDIPSELPPPDIPVLKAPGGTTGPATKVAEAADDHFYGPWKGGGKPAGGRPYGDPSTEDKVVGFTTSLNGDASPYATGTTLQQRLGNCYQYAGGYVLQTPDTNLIHGSIEGFGNPRIGHSWAEQLGPDGKVKAIYEPASNNMWPPKAFQSFFSPKVDARYSREQALVSMTKHGHFGPWDQ